MNNFKLKKISHLIIVAVSILFYAYSHFKKNNHQESSTITKNQNEHINVNTSDANAEILNAIKNSQPLKFVTIKNAKVIKLLRLDNKGIRHQRWVVQINDGITITIIYNIDIAEKIPLSEGDVIEAGGELVFGDQRHDPILHWTHADPRGKHRAGYVILNGKKYGAATGP